MGILFIQNVEPFTYFEGFKKKKDGGGNRRTSSVCVYIYIYFFLTEKLILSGWLFIKIIFALLKAHKGFSNYINAIY